MIAALNAYAYLIGAVAVTAALAITWLVDRRKAAS